MVDIATAVFWSLYNQIPWYVPLIIAIIAAAFCWQYIAPIWFLLPRWLQVTIGFIIAIIVAVQYGRNRGVQAEQQRRQTMNEHAANQRDQINERVKAMPPNAVSAALERRGWLRD